MAQNYPDESSTEKWEKSTREQRNICKRKFEGETLEKFGENCRVLRKYMQARHVLGVRGYLLPNKLAHSALLIPTN